MTNQPLFNPSIEMTAEKNNKLEIKITQEDKEKYLKSILSDVPYEETITLFDGSLSIKFKSMSVQENADMVNQVVLDKKSGVASDTDAYFVTISTYRLALCLASIDNQPYSSITKNNFSVTDENASYVLARAKPILDWQTPKLAIFLDAFQAFESKVMKLTNEVQTANFWKASA